MKQDDIFFVNRVAPRGIFTPGNTHQVESAKDLGEAWASRACMTEHRMRCGANAPLVLALLCAVPARAFVARAPLSARLLLAQQGPSSALAMARRGGLPGVSLRQGARLSMHMDYQGLVNAAALVGAALPDTPLTTNLGVSGPQHPARVVGGSATGRGSDGRWTAGWTGRK
jgi:hypothetical protein